MTIEKILVVDDDQLSREFLTEALATMGYDALSAENAEIGLQLLQDGVADLVFSDLKMPGMDGVEFLQAIKQLCPTLPVVLLTAHGTVESAVHAMQAGAIDFLLKPISPDALEFVLQRIVKERKLLQENEYLRKEFQGNEEFIGNSKIIRKVLQDVAKAAKAKATVLITGESGTGKERIAHQIHYASARSSGPFIRVNCAALSQNLLESELFGHERGAFTGAAQKREGRFELADGGTLLLDEISEIPLALQAKLLRVLEEEEFERVGGSKTLKIDVRVIATTNRDLPQEIAAGKFREDLFYRLNVFPINLPPLRDRLEDVPLLVNHFLKKYGIQSGSKVQSFGSQAVQKLQQYRWPGNVRELENIVQRLIVRDLSQEVRPEDFHEDLALNAAVPQQPKQESAYSTKRTNSQTLAEIERAVIMNTLEATNNNKTEAAKILGVSARTLTNKLKQYQEQKQEMRGAL